jgi:CDP-diacylglycerol---glycerol-3-phosphate 3-phosphatidyltransferase
MANWVEKRYLESLNSLIDYLARLKFNPNILTSLGLLITLLAAVFFLSGNLLWAAIVLIIAGNFDILDGQVARRSNQVTRFGAFYDSVLDRYAEIMLFLMINLHYSASVPYLIPIITWLALAGSILVSYTRARAESLGLNCKIGFTQRPLRIILLIVGALAGHFFNINIFFACLGVIAILANYTAIERIVYVYRTLKEKNK